METKKSNKKLNSKTAVRFNRSTQTWKVSNNSYSSKKLFAELNIKVI